MEAVTKYGISTVIAMILMAVIIKDVRADQKEILSEQQRMGAAIMRVADQAGQNQMLQEKILLVLRVSCLNEARNSTDRQECMRER